MSGSPSVPERVDEFRHRELSEAHGFCLMLTWRKVGSTVAFVREASTGRLVVRLIAASESSVEFEMTDTRGAVPPQRVAGSFEAAPMDIGRVVKDAGHQLGWRADESVTIVFAGETDDASTERAGRWTLSKRARGA